MAKLLDGKVAFITAARKALASRSRRQWRPKARAYAWLTCRRQDGGCSCGAGAGSIGLALDVTDEAATEKAAESAVQRLGRIDIVVPKRRHPAAQARHRHDDRRVPAGDRRQPHRCLHHHPRAGAAYGG